MSSAKKPASLIIGVVLMILLGLARGIGGIILLIQGKTTLSNIKTDESVLIFLSIGLIIIGIFEIISAVGIYYLKRKYWFLGIAVTVLFVIDGAINGYFLFGKPDDQGTLVNLFIAIIIITFLLIGGKSLNDKNKISQNHN
ncbi:MAG: hypothetical protein ACOYU5_00480 [Stygiobacter sp.]